MTPIITWLYVPGDRPDRFDKAVASGAQAVILDLEDAVAPERKAEARVLVADWLRLRDRDDTPHIEVRVNAGNDDDLTVLAAVNGTFGIRIPKVESPDDIDRVVHAIGRDVPVSALIETASGVESTPSIASHPMVMWLSIGEADLASDLGTADRGLLDWAQFRVLVAARAAGKAPPAAPVYTDINDLDGLAADTARWRMMGFVGRAAIHPTQVPIIAAAFVPSAAELQWAHEVLAALRDGGVATLPSGEMVDAAMRGRAETIVAMAELGTNR